MSGPTRRARAARRRLWRQQRGRCFYCRTWCIFRRVKPGKAAPPNLATLDHVIPRSAGGAFAPSRNGLMACLSCNNARGSMPFDEFVALKASEVTA